MTKEELLNRLSGIEWNDWEVKEAARDVPNSAYETVSAFANTAGGHLVFGVKEADGTFEVVGVVEVDKVQSAFLNTIRSGQKLSKIVEVNEKLIDCDGAAALVFYVPEVHRRDKPIFLNGDLRKSFVRRGSSDQHCTPDQIKAFLRDADIVSYDCHIVSDLNLETCFNAGSVSWYRSVFATKGQKYDPSASDLEFLHSKSFVRERDGKHFATRAAILLFGSEAAVRQTLGRPLVMCYKLSTNRDDPQPEERWSDRVVLEENLIETWRAINEWYLRHAEKPFSLDSKTLQRIDAPPDQEAFREAAVNLLIHQDYSDQARIPTIKFFRNAAVFHNPGHAFASDAELLTPGDKEVRNQLIRSAFRMVGFGEQGGTGIPAMMRGWQQLGYLPPRIRNDKEQRSFEVTMLRELLLSDEQLYYQASLGVSLTNEEARLFAYACRQQQVSEVEAKTVLSLPAVEARKILEKLAVQALLTVAPSGSHWLVAEHLRERFAQLGKPAAEPSLVTDQAGKQPTSLVSDQAPTKRTPLSGLTETQTRILELCAAPRGIADLLENIKVTNRTFFRRTHLNPLIEGGILQLRYPDNPRHPRQAYLLTEAGLRLLENRRARQKDQENTQ
jgi:ATP-dependent DNA helicase RecG